LYSFSKLDSSFSLRIQQLEKAVELKSQENKEIERQFEDYQNSTEKKMKQLQTEISLWKKKDEETAAVNDFYFHSLFSLSLSLCLKTNRFFLVFRREQKKKWKLGLSRSPTKMLYSTKHRLNL
jgi:hypothetical protein